MRSALKQPMRSALKQRKPDLDTAVATESNAMLMQICAIVICVVVWGTANFAVRQIVLPGGMQTFHACAVRFTISSVFLVLIFMFRSARLPVLSVRSCSWTLICGLLSVLSFSLAYMAQTAISGGLATIIATTGPILTAGLARLSKIESVVSTSFVGLLLSLLGTAIIFGDRAIVSCSQASGILMLFGAVVVSSFSNVVLKRNGTNLEPLVSVSIFSFIAALSFTILSIVFEGDAILKMPPIRPLMLTIYLAIMSSILSFVCYFYLLKRMSLVSMGKIYYLPPLIALTIDAFFEHQVVLTTTAYVGIVLTLAGVFLRCPRNVTPKD
jgi:drug/metabolite transporter (DMT)-like permease